MSEEKNLSGTEHLMQIYKEQKEAIGRLKSYATEALLKEQGLLAARSQSSILGSIKERPLLRGDGAGAPPTEPFASIEFQRNNKEGIGWVVFAIDAHVPTPKVHLLAGTTRNKDDKHLSFDTLESFDPSDDIVTQDWIREQVHDAIMARL